jgi:hypothetical protein
LAERFVAALPFGAGHDAVVVAVHLLKANRGAVRARARVEPPMAELKRTAGLSRNMSRPYMSSLCLEEMPDACPRPMVDVAS